MILYSDIERTRIWKTPDQYERLSYIARGSYGYVYNMKANGVKTKLVMKIMSVRKKRHMIHFMDEVRIGMKIHKDASLSKIALGCIAYGFMMKDGILRGCMVMPHLDASLKKDEMRLDLHDYMKYYGTFSFNDLVKYIYTIRLFTYLSEMFHGDLHPGNVQVYVKNGRINRFVLIDFGFKKSVGEVYRLSNRTNIQNMESVYEGIQRRSFMIYKSNIHLIDSIVDSSPIISHGKKYHEYVMLGQSAFSPNMRSLKKFISKYDVLNSNRLLYEAIHKAEVKINKVILSELKNTKQKPDYIYTYNAKLKSWEKQYTSTIKL